MANRTIVVGMLAHVDAGKTTLSEAALFKSGATRKLGRVDHGDAFLDTDTMERRRGITIFSKQARMNWSGAELVLVDTPGHVDFCTEAERTLQVLDCAVLVISGTDGVQPHTETLWKLLRSRGIPTLVFVNKMDLDGTDCQAVLENLSNRLGEGFVDWAAPRDDGFMESIAILDEQAMDEFLELGTLAAETLSRLVTEGLLHPCFFGSALRLEGIEEFLNGLVNLVKQPEWPQEFGARICKISHDSRGERLAWMKVTGGELRAKTVLRGGQGEASDALGEVSAADAVNGWHPGPNSYIKSAFGDASAGGQAAGRGPWEEKVNQVRLYSGDKYEVVDSVPAGQLCAVTGLSCACAGEALGAECADERQSLVPVLAYSVEDTGGADAHKVLQALRVLEDEDPALDVSFDEESGRIRLKLMGAVQMEVLVEELQDRFGLQVAFGPGGVLYRETITAPAKGGGHFEPLRHYAEMRLEIEPLQAGSGILAGSMCSEDDLDLNWQRLIVTHFLEKEHLGVLTGAPITAVRLTLVAGRAHAKHTNGGDFRQATYRGIRQALMRAREAGACKLLEPWYSFTLEVPSDVVGRAMADIQKMGGSFDAPEQRDDIATLRGRVPVAEAQDYALEVSAYSKGMGRLSLVVEGYDACHNQTEVVERVAYDPCADLANTPDSVFCFHGAGYNVPWNEVEEHLHTL